MKYFFTAAIASSEPGQAHSAEAVRQRIRQMIDDEDPEEVLSDDVIVERLRKADILVARRTVAKYRDSLRIPSSVERRKMKMAPMRARVQRDNSLSRRGVRPILSLIEQVIVPIDSGRGRLLTLARIRPPQDRTGAERNGGAVNGVGSRRDERRAAIARSRSKR